MAPNSTIGGSQHPFYLCTEVSPYCPVEATTLGYYPNKGINIFFAVSFGTAALTTAALGVWKRTWSYTIFITLGSALDLAGYAARVPLSTNPWNKDAFETQICTIVLAPTLICISIYLTLKHLCLSLNPSLSRVRPSWYPFIFVPADVSCLLVQAIGGALAASAGYTNYNLLQHGNRCIIAGISLQVLVLSFFGIASLDYYRRTRSWIKSNQASPEAVALWHEKKFRLFVYAVAGAYGGILIRCIYRVAEMAGGWGNKIMQDQPSFIVLEGFMVLIPVWLLAIFSPGLMFPDMAKRMSESVRKALHLKRGTKSVSEKTPEPTTAAETPNPGEESQEGERHQDEQLMSKSQNDVAVEPEKTS